MSYRKFIIRLLYNKLINTAYMSLSIRLLLVMSSTASTEKQSIEKNSSKVHICVYVVGKLVLVCSSNSANTYTHINTHVYYPRIEIYNNMRVGIMF